jgi:hypothetical protein
MLRLKAERGCFVKRKGSHGSPPLGSALILMACLTTLAPGIRGPITVVREVASILLIAALLVAALLTVSLLVLLLLALVLSTALLILIVGHTCLLHLFQLCIRRWIRIENAFIYSMFHISS